MSPEWFVLREADTGERPIVNPFSDNECGRMNGSTSCPYGIPEESGIHPNEEEILNPHVRGRAGGVWSHGNLDSAELVFTLEVLKAREVGLDGVFDVGQGFLFRIPLGHTPFQQWARHHISATFGISF